MPYFEMARLALKWAVTKPPTTRYPFAPREFIAGSRGQLVFSKENCAYCTVCAKKCPAAALTVNRALKRLTLDRLRCISCGYCVEVCPKESLALSPNHGAPTISKDLEIYHA